MAVCCGLVHGGLMARKDTYKNWDYSTNTFRRVLKMCDEKEVPRFKTVKDFTKFKRNKLYTQECR